MDVKNLTDFHAFFFFNKAVHLYGFHSQHFAQTGGYGRFSCSHKSYQQDISVKQRLGLYLPAVFHNSFKNMDDFFAKRCAFHLFANPVQLLFLLFRLQYRKSMVSFVLNNSLNTLHSGFQSLYNFFVTVTNDFSQSR